MDKQKLITIVENREHKSNADLMKALDLLQEEFEQTKDTIVNLTLHMDQVERYFYQVAEELKKRKGNK